MRDALVDATNFVLLLPVYFIGVGMSKLLWELSMLFKRHDAEPDKSYWIDSKALPDRIEELEKMV